MPPLPKKLRHPDDLVASGLKVLDKAFRLTAGLFINGVPLFSGGYDSLSACYVASKHWSFKGVVYHIDTGIGSTATREYVNQVCDDEGWRLEVLKSRDTYEKLVRTSGFPGPGAHQWVYNRIKDRCLREITRYYSPKYKWALITGCRSSESARRMGTTKPIQYGETSKRTGKVSNKKRVWVAPCHDWTDAEQRAFINYHRFPLNPIKESILGMSGECFCGAFARPNELEMIRQVCPEVAQEIDRLTQVAAECGISEANRYWGRRDRKKLEVLETGPMCSSCDRKAAAAGIIVQPT